MVLSRFDNRVGFSLDFTFFKVTHLELASPAKNYSAPGSTKSFLSVFSGFAQWNYISLNLS